MFSHFRERKVGEVIEHVAMPPVLFEDFEKARVLLIRRRENPRGFSGQKKRREPTAAADHAPDDKHAATLTLAAVFANPGCPAAWGAHSDGAAINGIS